MSRTVEIRSWHFTAAIATLELEDNERVVSVEREGNEWWVYVEKRTGGVPGE